MVLLSTQSRRSQLGPGFKEKKLTIRRRGVKQPFLRKTGLSEFWSFRRGRNVTWARGPPPRTWGLVFFMNGEPSEREKIWGGDSPRNQREIRKPTPVARQPIPETIHAEMKDLSEEGEKRKKKKKKILRAFHSILYLRLQVFATMKSLTYET